MTKGILLIGNDGAATAILRKQLRHEGYLVDTASDGVDGFHKATTLPFDLIILDVELPHQDGSFEEAGWPSSRPSGFRKETSGNVPSSTELKKSIASCDNYQSPRSRAWKGLKR
jgi:hypothetical protein